MSNIYVVASHVQHAQEKIREIRAYREVTRLGVDETLLIPVFQESDMRGRKVGADDMVVVCGDWSGRPVHVVAQLVEMFNSRRDGDRAPRLTYRTGEAPEVRFWEPTGDPIEIQTMGGATYTINPATATTTTTSTQVAWEQVLAPHEQRMLSDAVDAAKRERAIAADMRNEVKKAKAEVERVTAENRELRSWLSGVQPVEDPDLPGLFYCGICSVKIPRHTDGCPAAP